jgi:hypothetical protein
MDWHFTTDISCVLYFVHVQRADEAHKELNMTPTKFIPTKFVTPFGDVYTSTPVMSVQKDSFGNNVLLQRWECEGLSPIYMRPGHKQTAKQAAQWSKK